MSSPSKSLIFLGAKPIGYQCLEYLLSVREALGITVSGVLTQTRKEFGGDHDLRALATANNIPLLATANEIPPCDILYSVQYHEILKQDHIDKAAQIAVNLHMAPLPEYRGCNQFSFAIIDGREEFGTTIHRMDAGIDHGDILFESRFAIPENCWVDTLYQMTESASLQLFKDSLGKIINGLYSPTSQASLIETRGTSIHYRKDIRQLKEIDLSWPVDKIDRHIRASSMPGFEPPYTMIGGKKIFFRTDPS